MGIAPKILSAHFQPAKKRYYYDFDYDWARLDYLKSVYERLHPLIDKDLEDYVDFLLTCANEDAP